MRDIDPILLAVLNGRLVQIADEMDATLYRSAFNPIIAEAHDVLRAQHDQLRIAVDGLAARSVDLRTGLSESSQIRRTNAAHDAGLELLLRFADGECDVGAAPGATLSCSRVEPLTPPA